MGAEEGESGGVDGLGGALGFGAAVDGEKVDSGVLDGLDEVDGLAGIVRLSRLYRLFYVSGGSTVNPCVS